MTPTNVGIDICDVHQRYGRRPVLKGVTLAVPEGATTVLLGANGEGKTTLLKLCLGVLRPREGVVRVLDMDPISDASKLRETIGYVPDKPDAYGWMRIGDLFRYLRAHYPTWDDERARELVDTLVIPTRSKFKQMSRGQGMKAMLAAALSHHPDVLLLDEPFGGLDPLVREDVLRNVIEAMGDRPRTVLLTTHDLDVASRVADRIAVMADGVISAEGPAAEIAGNDEDSPTPESLRRALAEAVQGSYA